MKISIAFLSSFLIFSQACLAQSAPHLTHTPTVSPKNKTATSSWIGTYEFGDDSGQTAGGSSTLVDRTITIKMSGAKTVAIFSSEGYQSDEKILCDTALDGIKMILIFRGYPGGGVKNAFGVQVYKMGAPLLTLEKRMVKGKTKLLTYWNEFTPNNVNAKSGTVCFTQAK